VWPALVVGDPDLQGFDVYRVDYESRFFSFQTRPKGADIAGAVFEVLRPALRRYPKVFFIAHSMGGNIVRDYLVMLKASTPGPPAGPGHRILLPYVDGVFLLGTPVEGAQIASLGQLATNDPALRVLLPIDVNDYLALLNRQWGNPNNCDPQDPRGVQCRAMLTLGTALQVYAACEERQYSVAGLPTPILVVPRESATALSPKETKCFDRDHSTLVAPSDRTDPVYEWVKTRILRSLRRS
jgi:alpha-beta hydrolase superfamily lysophospholipase